MGNICRSPSAEAVLRTKAQQRGIELCIDSAGTLDLHQGCPPDPRSVLAGETRGYNFEGISSRPIVHSDFEDFDIIALMDEDNWDDVMLRCPDEYKIKIKFLLNFAYHDINHSASKDEQQHNHIIPAPYYSHDEGFDDVLDLIEQGCDGLLDWHSKHKQ
jgi:protein-tyrosine phosphatase